ncbi:MAG: LamG domain-containing protein [Candidatus Njordarchaeia archaeon]
MADVTIGDLPLELSPSPSGWVEIEQPTPSGYQSRKARIDSLVKVAVKVELENDEYICNGIEASITIDISEFESDVLSIIISGATDSDNYGSNVNLRFNNDDSASYYWGRGYVKAGGLSEGEGTFNSTYIHTCILPGNNTYPSGTTQVGYIMIFNYRDVNSYTHILCRGFYTTNSSWQNIRSFEGGGGIYAQKNRVTSVTLYIDNGTFKSGTKVKVIGDKIKGQVAGNSGEEFTTWVKVYEKEIISATDEFEITGLDGDTDEIYKIIFEGKGNASSACHVNLQLNGDSNSANYKNKAWTDWGTGDETHPGMFFGYYDDPNEEFWVEGILYAKSGRLRKLIKYGASQITSSGIVRTEQCASLWTNTTDNITSIKVKCEQVANSLIAGHFELWKLKKITLPQEPSTPVQLENGEYICKGTENSVTIDVSDFDGENLRIEALLRTQYSGSNEADRLKVRFNNDSNSNYGFIDHFVYVNGTGKSNHTQAFTEFSTDHIKVLASTNDAPTGAFTQAIIDILGFKETKYKFANIQTNFRTPSGGTNRLYHRIATGVWYNTNPITSITFSTEYGHNFVAGSKIKIYTEKIKGQTVGSSGEEFITWTKHTEVELGAPNQDIDITGLDLQSDRRYRLEYFLKSESGDRGVLRVYIDPSGDGNVDTTNTNYYFSSVISNGNGANATSSQLNETSLGYLQASDNGIGIAEIFLDESNYFRHLAQYTYDGDYISRVYTHYVRSANPVTNVTKLRLHFEGTNLSAGSKIIVWKQKKVTLPQEPNTPVQLENGEYICKGTENSVTIDVSKFEGEILDIEFYHKRDSNYGTPTNCYIRLNGDTSSSYASNSTSIGSNGSVSNWGNDDSPPVDFLLRMSANLGADGRSFQLWTRLFNYKENDKWTFALGTYTTPYDRAWFYTLAGTYMKNDVVTSITFSLDNNAKFTPGDRIRIRTEKIKGAVSDIPAQENLGYNEILTDRDFEIEPGKWKKVYMRKYDLNALPNNTTKTKPHNISDLEYAFYEAFSVRPSDRYIMHLPSPDDNVDIHIDNTNISIKTNSDLTAFTETYMKLFYTKSSDSVMSEPRNPTVNQEETWTANSIKLTPLDCFLERYWAFEEASGNFIDKIEGTTAAPTNITRVDGKHNKCASFTHTGSYIKVLNSDYDFAATVASKKFTISLWFKTSSTNMHYKSLFGNIGSTSSGVWGFQRDTTNFSDEKLEVRLANAGSSNGILTSANEFHDGNWHHFCLVVDGSNAKMYIDGSVEASITNLGTIGDANYDLYIGDDGQSTAGNDCWDGEIDEFKVWSVPLPESHVIALYNQGTGSFRK